MYAILLEIVRQPSISQMTGITNKEAGFHVFTSSIFNQFKEPSSNLKTHHLMNGFYQKHKELKEKDIINRIGVLPKGVTQPQIKKEFDEHFASKSAISEIISYESTDCSSSFEIFLRFFLRFFLKLFSK